MPFLLPFLPMDVDRSALDAAFAAARGKAPAIAAAVVKDGTTVWARGKGATPDSPFRIASLTKAFTATVVLQLVKEKKASLDDPIGKALPSLPVAWRRATVRQLLNHTSGIPSYTSLPDFAAHAGERLTPEGIVARTAGKPLDFPSGTKFEYDNTGYVVLGLLVERLDHRSFAESLQARILKPLGMARTRLDVGGDKPEALGFDAEGKPAIAMNMSQPYSAGSVVSTANDMAKWLAAQGSERLLPKRLWDEAWKSGVLADGKATGYGFGWIPGSLNGVPTVEHGGGIPGFSSYVQRVPSKGLAAIVLTNSEGGDPQGVARALLGAADATLKAPDVSVADPDPKITEATERLLHGFEKGTPDKSVMAAGLAEVLSPDVLKGGQQFLSQYGSLCELRLTKVDGLRRVYRAVYEKGAITVTIARDAEGRFTGFAIGLG